ncbi:putative membrane protein [Sporomusaceae bacterium BoRhaA]|uniref:YibE/F family protein n=1 Tax=Pelorhabdus rhamnosifermentans TaxID=2772457 RepID=UPI001FEA45EE|nr:YibE/F family protein [Pelorhabdus rhamnosifermentans]MBU2701275.1 putative membrane protein [Pelorhabdus rhamnosifermentans]
MMKKIMIRLCVAIFLLVGSIALYQYGQVDRPALVNTDGRIFQRGIVTDVIKDNLQENGSRIGDQIVHVKFKDKENTGHVVEANCPNGLLFGAVCKPGMDVVVISSKMGSINLHTIYSMDRSMPIFLFIALFLLLLCLIGGKKGIKSAVALIFTFIWFLFLFFPMLLHGIQPIVAAILTSFLILVTTIYLINGITIKALSAGIASIGGIFTAGLTAILFGKATALSGYNVSNIESLLFVAQNMPIDVGQILFAGILFASLGAVMDIAMDVASAVDELQKKNKNLSPKDLFESGLRVGRDVMGTMSTTLILAFFGGSLGVWVLNYAYNLPYLQLLNSNAVGIELMQGLAGSLGVILTVPLTAACSAWLPEYVKKREKLFL